MWLDQENGDIIKKEEKNLNLIRRFWIYAEPRAWWPVVVVLVFVRRW